MLYRWCLLFRPFKFVEDLNEFAEPDTEELEGVVAIKGHDRYVQYLDVPKFTETKQLFLAF